ncbi:hypothetical protein [Bacillus sp. JJ1474]|uniref:hypothetical protein n=1 Tax=Bacillus sp. JJ1474 TaxID=3122955 RepID=UPI002FFF128F
MEVSNQTLIVDYRDLYQVQQMLQGGTDLRGCIESLFIINGHEPKWIESARLSSEPNENQKLFAEMVLKEI